MNNGGFDVVIGNPPYVSKTFSDEMKKYIKSNYQTAEYQLDLYVSFIEKGVMIAKDKGCLSYIVPNSWLKNMMMSECRKFLLINFNIKKIVPSLGNVFPEASVDTMIFIGIKQNAGKETKVFEFRKEKLFFKHSVNQERFSKNYGFVFDVEVSKEILPIINKINKDTKLVSELFDVTRGINPYDKYRGQLKEVIESRAYHADHKKDVTFVPELKGLHTSRYNYTWDSKHYISYGNWLAAPRQIKYFEGSRIIFREILGKTLVSTLITENFKIDRSLYIAKLEDREKEFFDIKFILGILNSKLMAFYFRYTNNEFDNLFPKIRVAEFKKLPIKNIDFQSQNNLSEKTTTMLSLNKHLQEKKTTFLNRIKSNIAITKITKKLDSFFDYDFKQFITELKKQKATISLKDQDEWEEYFNQYKSEINQLQTQIFQTDNEIDQMVYKLYDLTYQEVQIIDSDFTQQMSEDEFNNLELL